MPKFMMYANLNRAVIKALFIKVTELEEYELDYLRDIYFNP